MSKVIGWAFYENVGMVLFNFGETTDPLGRKWKLNFMHNKPDITFNPDGSLIAVISKDGFWNVIDPWGHVLRPGNLKEYAPTGRIRRD